MTDTSEEILRRNALLFMKVDAEDLYKMTLPTRTLHGKKLIVAIIEDKR